MSTPIFGNSASLQALKAQQAWEARKAASKTRVESTATETASTQTTTPVGNQSKMAERTQAPSDSQVDDTALDHNARLARAIPEIQAIAKKAGFVGVTAQDIQRAYAFGESLLTDYRV
jgi:hypothetical protein